MIHLDAANLPKLFAALTADGCLRRLVDEALREDLGEAGDITSLSIVPEGRSAQANLRTRQQGTVAGLACTPGIVAACRLAATPRYDDGRSCDAGDVLATFTGDLRGILAIERVLLNIVGRLSGIATLTSRYVSAIAGTGAVVCETRKTTPGMRNLEKYAVACGGGTLHRLGLYDALLYKDNHLAGIPNDQLSGRLDEAIRRARASHEVRFVEVEVDSLEQFREVIKIGKALDIVLLDNMGPAVMRQAVELRNSHAPHLQLEASGGVNLESVRSIAQTGVDRISVGALTHSVSCLDVGLDIDE